MSRGFARMSPERRRLIAQRGNKKLREQGKEHRFTTDEAREAVGVKQKRAAIETSQHQRGTEEPDSAG